MEWNTAFYNDVIQDKNLLSIYAPFFKLSKIDYRLLYLHPHDVYHFHIIKYLRKNKASLIMNKSKS